MHQLSIEKGGSAKVHLEHIIERKGMDSFLAWKAIDEKNAQGWSKPFVGTIYRFV